MPIKASSSFQWRCEGCTSVNHRLDLVVACDRLRGIGKDNSLPWRLAGDLKQFKKITSTVEEKQKKNAVIVGRKTWESIPEGRRPLKDRLNVILTRDKNYSVPEGAMRCHSLEEALGRLENENIENVFIIGGADLYAQAMEHPLCDTLYLTDIKAEFDCDTFLPDFKEKFDLVSAGEPICENDLEYSFKVYKKKKS